MSVSSRRRQSECSGRAPRRLVLLAALALALVGQRAGAQADLAADVARLTHATSLLEERLALASGDGFYLILDPAASELALMLNGAELRRFPVQAMFVGAPRVAFVRRRTTAAWEGIVWSGGRLDPPRPSDRLEITVPAPGTSGGPAAPLVPPPPEELFPVPARYHIRFDTGLSIEVRPRDPDASTSRWARFVIWWRTCWQDALEVLGPQLPEAARLRLALGPADAEALYRALPPNTNLLVLPWEQRQSEGAVPAR